MTGGIAIAAGEKGKNPLHDPLLLGLSGNYTLPGSSPYYVMVTPTAGGFTLAVPSGKSHLITNIGAYSFTVDLVTIADVVLAPGDEVRVAWDRGLALHTAVKYEKITIDAALSLASNNPVRNSAVKAAIDALTVGAGVAFVESAVPADDSAPGLYSVQTGSNRGLYMSSGTGPVYLITAYATDGTWPIT